jgi:hypothetical protein
MIALLKQYLRGILLFCPILIITYVCLFLLYGMRFDAADSGTGLGFYSSNPEVVPPATLNYFYDSFMLAQAWALILFPLFVISLKKHLSVRVLPWVIVSVMAIMGFINWPIQKPFYYATSESGLEYFILSQAVLGLGLCLGYAYIYITGLPTHAKKLKYTLGALLTLVSLVFTFIFSMYVLHA